MLVNELLVVHRSLWLCKRRSKLSDYCQLLNFQQFRSYTPFSNQYKSQPEHLGESIQFETKQVMSNKLIQIILLVCVICVVQTLCDNCPLTAADIEGPCKLTFPECLKYQQESRLSTWCTE